MATLEHNKPRVARIEKIIKRDNGTHIDDKKAGVSDILANLRHYCDAHGFDFAELDRAAHQHYLHELKFTD